MIVWGKDTQSEEAQSKDAQREMKRMAILRAASKSFNTFGYHQTSLNDLANTLGVTKPALYRYVEGKEDILKQCLNIAQKQIHDAILELQKDVENSSLTGREQFKLFFIRFAEMSSDDFGACLILSRGSIADESFREQYRSVAREISQSMNEIVDIGIADRSIQTKHGRMLIAAMLGAINEAVYWQQKEGRVSPEKIAEQFFSLFETGF
ncbi:MAG: AcrR family transcriptional regulator [Candidatus Promineifilaceae bacterium]|jgi:AcrR family transcriptional regulator